jgi:PKD repeat protein
VTGGSRQGVVDVIPSQSGAGAGGGAGGASGGTATTFARTFTGLSGPATGDVGASLAFSASVEVGSVDSYAWDFGDGTSTTTATGSVNHTFTTAGTFTVTATATMSGTGAESSATTDVDVADVPISGLVASNNGPTILGARTRLSAQVAAGTNITYAWDFGDGTNGSGRVVRHRYKVAGTHVATVTASNTAGSDSAETQVVVSPVISVAPASVGEGTAPLPNGAKYTVMRFAITLSGPSTDEVSVMATTSNGSAVAPADYRSRAATVSIAAGLRKATFTVKIVPDAKAEGDEQFTVTLSAPTNATLGTATAAGTIIDDD